jgi:hypothetical protein
LDLRQFDVQGLVVQVIRGPAAHQFRKVLQFGRCDGEVSFGVPGADPQAVIDGSVESDLPTWVKSG